MMTNQNRQRAWGSALLASAACATLVFAACAVDQPQSAGPTEPELARQAMFSGDTLPTAAHEPTFTPREQDPRILNVDEFTDALRAAYPAALRDAGIGGRVGTWIFVDEEGAVLNTRVQESSNHEELDRAAMAAVRTLRFAPALNRGEPVGVWVQFPVAFGASAEQHTSPPSPSTRANAAPVQRNSPAPPTAEAHDSPSFTPREHDPELLNGDALARAIEAAYPPELREASNGGTVLLWVHVDEGGSVTQTRVQESSGHEELDGVAMNLIRTAQFKPATNRGEAVPVWMQIPVSFRP